MGNSTRRLERKKRNVYIRTDYQAKASPCPKCKAILNAATGIRVRKEDDPKIRPGAFTLCCECGQCLKYGPHLDLEIATEAEIRAKLAPEMLKTFLIARNTIITRLPN